MGSITSLGAGSGLDLEALVSKLMTVERQPLALLESKEKTVNSKISALGTLKSKLSSLQTAAQGLKASIGQSAAQAFATYSAESAAPGVLSATTGANAAPGVYELNITKLAKADRFVSAGAGASSTASSAIGQVGDTLSFSFATPDSGGNSRDFTITLDSSNNSLTGLRNAINAKNAGITATIVNGTNGPQLILDGTQGADNKIVLGGNLASNFSQPRIADNAAFTINGVSASSASNTVTGLIDGVTFTLKAEQQTTLTVSAEYQTKATSTLEAFIKAYNDANSTIRTMGAYDASTKKAGSLQGNEILRNAQYQIRDLVFSITSDSSTTAHKKLSNIGITVGTDGSLSLNADKLTSALKADPASVTDLLSKVGSSYTKELEKIVGITGSIQTSTEASQGLLKSLKDQASKLEDRLSIIEARYRKRFNALDSLISKYNSTSTYLTQQIAGLSAKSSSQ